VEKYRGKYVELLFNTLPEKKLTRQENLLILPSATKGLFSAKGDRCRLQVKVKNWKTT
jgi:hypothetical protein